jgi:hypothetical protein
VSLQSGELIAKKHCDLHVGRIAIVKVASKDDERRFLFDCCVNELFKGIPASPTYTLDLRCLRQDEREQWTVEVNIGGMKKFECTHRDPIEQVLPTSRC